MIRIKKRITIEIMRALDTMVIERRHDMLRYQPRRWRDKVFSICAGLTVFFTFMNVTYTWLSAPWLDVKGALRGFLYSPAGVNWNGALSAALASPVLAFGLAIGCSELVIFVPSIIWWYGKFLLMLVDVALLALTVWVWDGNGFAMGAALLAVAFAFTFYCGRDSSIWQDVMWQVKCSSRFLHTRLAPVLGALPLHMFFMLSIGMTILQGFAVWRLVRVQQANLLIMLIVAWIIHMLFQFTLRGIMMAHYIDTFFLRGTPHYKPGPKRRALVQLLTGSFGTIFLAAVYYGTRNALVMIGVLAYTFRLGDSPQPGSHTLACAIIISNLLIVHMASSQRFRSLFQIVAYAYRFAEALMLTEVYPSFKVDLVNKFTSSLAFIIASAVGSLAYLFLVSISRMSMADALRLAFLITMQAYMTAQLVFEPIRAASFTLAVGLVEDPKFLLTRISWLKLYYPAYL